jgi:outer membrane protein assembly factor BamB
MIWLSTVAALMVATLSTPGGDPWPQWGGPSRNFVIEARGLAVTWPADGPRRVWKRALGDGYSGIVADDAAIYTMYRAGDQDAVVALDRATGTTKWESKYDAPFNETCSQRLGPVPRAAPLLMADRIITISAGGLMNSFDRKTGARQWSVDLLGGATNAVRACGYSSSPVAFGDLVISTGGGPGRGVVAVQSSSGKIAWQSQDFQNGYSSPLLIDLDGQPELIIFTYGEVAGLNPKTGALEWSRPHPSDQGVNVTTPIWGPDNLLFVSSAYDGGSRVLRLKRNGDQVSVEELWANKRVRIHFGNAVRLGETIYCSNGDFGSAPFAAVDVKTGDMLWRDRAVTRATLLGVGDKLILLDEDGNLALATPSSSGLTVHAKATVLSHTAWTAPTLVGTTLYLRDRQHIVAIELGAQ